MRDALINIFNQQVTLENNTRFSYTISPYELRNSLGAVVAILQQYNFTRSDINDGALYCRLYKTKEGYWYDISDDEMVADKNILRMLKTALDNQEGKLALAV